MVNYQSKHFCKIVIDQAQKLDIDLQIKKTKEAYDLINHNWKAKWIFDWSDKAINSDSKERYDVFIVNDNVMQNRLIMRGVSYSKIILCPFWGPTFENRNVTPARYGQQVSRVNDDLPLTIKVNELHHYGGIGVVQSKEELTLNLIAGLPIAVTNNSALTTIINRYRVGFTYVDKADLQESLNNMDENEYLRWAQNSATLGQMIVNGDFLREVLIRCNRMCLTNQVKNRKQPRFGIKVMDTMETLDYIQRYRPSVARFGDGEISLMLGVSQVFQKGEPLLQQRLKEIIQTPSDHKLLVCLSDVFHDLDRYVPTAKDWWAGHLDVFQDYYSKLGKRNLTFGNTMMTRPYMDMKDRNLASQIFKRIKSWWDNCDILIVEGTYTRSGVGNDLYANARSVQRIICPSKNAWSKYQEIEAAIKKYGTGKVVLVMLGMTATVIAADLADWDGGQVIDSGHLDPEYEWYQMGATKRIQISGKHTAEMNYDDGVPEKIHNSKYSSEIVLDLSK